MTVRLQSETPCGVSADAVSRFRNVLRAAERGGHWQVIEAAHKALLQAEIEQWIQNKFGGGE